MQRYVKPTATGTGDGKTLANAAALSSINTQIKGVGPGGTVNVIADVGDYSVTKSITISFGGVTIRGVDSSLNPMRAKISGGRTAFVRPANPDTPTSVIGWNHGPEVFRLGAGANNLTFKDLYLQNCQNVFSVVDNIYGLTVDGYQFYNVMRLLEMVSGKSASYVTIRNGSGVGYSKQSIRMRGSSHDWLVENVSHDSARQDGDNFAVGFEMSESAHNLAITGCTFKNAHGSNGSAFWNGDGFSAEASNYNIAITGGEFSGNTDAGIDIKNASGSTVRITGVLVKDNKNNLKFWGNTALGTATFILSNVTSQDPRNRGGTGGYHHIDGANGATIIVRDASKFIDGVSGGAIYAMENYPGSYHIASDTVESSSMPRTSFFAETTIDNLVP